MRVLVTGAGGMLARALLRELERRGCEVVAFDRTALDITDSGAVERLVLETLPDVVIQCAAYTRVDDAEAEEAEAHRVNAEATRSVARACRRVGARFVYPSTDYVFDGRAGDPYPPDASTSPLNAYGRSKLAGEIAAREAGDYLIVRTSWLYGAGGRNFVATILERARAAGVLRVVADQRGSPTWTGSLAAVVADLLKRHALAGVYHATNRGETTWYGLAREAVRLADVHADVRPVSSDAFPRPAARPRYSVLDCSATEAVVGQIESWDAALAAALLEGLA